MPITVSPDLLGELDFQTLEEGETEKEVKQALKTTKPEELHAYELFDDAMKKRIDEEAAAEYDQMTDDVMGELIPYGGPEVQKLNEIQRRLLDEVEPVNIPEVDELTRKLIDSMAGLKKYDLRQKKVLDTVQDLGNRSRLLFQRPDNYAQSVLEAARGERAVINGLLRDLEAKMDQMKRNALFLQVMHKATSHESLKLLYALAVLERVKLYAEEDMAELAGQKQKIESDSESADGVGDLTTFIRMVEMKIDGLRARLVSSTQSGPEIRDMHMTMVGMATTLWSLEQLAVPGMEGTLLRWIFQATALQAGHLKQRASQAVQDWAIAGAEAAAKNIPAAMGQALAPIMPDEAVAKITELEQLRNTGVLNVYKDAAEQLKRSSDALRIQRLSAQQADLNMAEAIDPEMVDRAQRLSSR